MSVNSLRIGKIAIAALLCTTLAAPQAFAVTAAEKRAEADAITEQIDAMQTGLNEMRALHEKASAEYAEAIALRDEAATQVEAEAARVEALQERMASFAVSMYKDGGAASFLGVLLQTNSFHEFMTSWDRISVISDTGSQLLADEKAAREELEKARTTYETQAKRAEQQMAIAESSMKQIEETQADLREEVAKLSDEASKLEEQEKEKDKDKKKAAEVTAEEARKAEEERKAKEAEIEKRAKEAAAAAAAAVASAHAEASAAVLMGEGYFTNPCPTATESSGFGYREFDNSFHKGLDMAAPQGTPYFAADDGTVLYATNDGGYNGGAGNWVVIAHGNGIVTKYMHSMTTFVKPGDQVTRGQNIGLVGNTGQSFGAHLHFQVEVDGVAVNPLNYI
ncbi:MAG: peptidoglycan DD-metalloendopeptidase family protein [Eggerthellaceae bacterium]|nr:peptidoglycan DD-metalloendopeptidase family protein [Eggerthellaceae bacterium]